MRQSRLGDVALSACGGRVGWLVRVAGAGRLGGAVLLPSAAVRDSRDDARRSRRRIHARTSRISGRKGSAITATTTIASTWPAAYFPETREEPDMSQTFGEGNAPTIVRPFKACALFITRGEIAGRGPIRPSCRSHPGISIMALSCGFGDPRPLSSHRRRPTSARQSVTVPSARLVRSTVAASPISYRPPPTRPWSHERESVGGR